METSRAEALHDLDRNSIGTLGLSGRWVPPAAGRKSGWRQLIMHFGSMSSVKLLLWGGGVVLNVYGGGSMKGVYI